MTSEAALPKIVILVVISAVCTASGQSNEVQRNEPRIQKSVREAKAKGQNKVVLTIPGEGAAMVRGLDDALATFPALVVIPVGRASTLSPLSEWIGTWYKFRVVSSLCKAPPTPTSVPRTTPPDLLPLQPGEIFVTVPGGRLDIEGVTIEDIDRDLAPLELGKEYLIFPDFLDRSEEPGYQAVGNMTLGPTGVFSIDGDRLVPSKKWNPLARDVHDKLDDRLSLLRNYASDHCESLTTGTP